MRRLEWVMSFVVGVMLSLAVSSSAAIAQTDPPRGELGGQLNLVRLSDSSDTNIGFGGRVTFNVTRWLGIEGEYQFLPKDEINSTSVVMDGNVVGLRYERRRSTAVFGVKAGYRGQRVGVFAKVRPGVTLLSNRGVDCLGDVCALMLLAVPDYRSEFVLDAGVVVELYPSSRWIARADVGSLIIKHRSSAPPCVGSDCTSANLATSLGFGVRF